MKIRSGFLFLGIYLCVDEHGGWVWRRKKERKRKNEEEEDKKVVGGGVGMKKKEK